MSFNFQLVATYTCQRKTMRWPIVIFFNMLDVSAYNSFVLWTEMDPMWNKQKCFKRRLFLEELGEALVTPFMIRRQGIPRTPASQNMIKEAQAFFQVNEASPRKALYHNVMEARACSVSCACVRVCTCVRVCVCACVRVLRRHDLVHCP